MIHSTISVVVSDADGSDDSEDCDLVRDQLNEAAHDRGFSREKYDCTYTKESITFYDFADLIDDIRHIDQELDGTARVDSVSLNVYWSLSVERKLAFIREASSKFD